MTDAEPARDLLGDLRTVLAGADRMRSKDALGQLGERRPNSYGPWSSQQFAAALSDAGVTIRQGRVDGEAGQRYLAADDVLHAQAEQADNPHS